MVPKIMPTALIDWGFLSLFALPLFCLFCNHNLVYLWEGISGCCKWWEWILGSGWVGGGVGGRGWNCPNLNFPPFNPNARPALEMPWALFKIIIFRWKINEILFLELLQISHHCRSWQRVSLKNWVFFELVPTCPSCPGDLHWGQVWWQIFSSSIRGWITLEGKTRLSWGRFFPNIMIFTTETFWQWWRHLEDNCWNWPFYVNSGPLERT